MTDYSGLGPRIGRRQFLAGSAGVAAILSLPRGPFAAQAPGLVKAPVIMTTRGKVEGTMIQGVGGYLAIPYAAPPVGPLRFKPPRKPAAWDGVRDCTRYAHVAVQQLSGAFSPEGMAREGKLLTDRPPPMADNAEARRAAHRVPQSEDCLYLDVWTKGNDGTKRPVMVWFHGGGYAFGSGSARISVGDNLIKAGEVVLVTITHRLNAFGYLFVDDLADFQGSGNVGNLDLVASLEWVRDNIEAFGGDPDNVTIFGESGGGAKTSALLAMPSAKGLYHKAIVQSGSTIRVTERADATALTKLVLAELNIPEGKAASLQAVEARALFDASVVAESKAREAGIHARFRPVLDGSVLLRHPFDPDAPALAVDIPMMVGTTKDEGTLGWRMDETQGNMTEAQLKEQVGRMLGARADEALKMYAELHPGQPPVRTMADISTASGTRKRAIVMAQRKTAQGTAPVFYYIFAWETPGAEQYGSNHGIEVAIQFGNAGTGGWAGTDAAKNATIQQIMMKTWTAFAWNGTPDNATIPSWPAYNLDDRPTMILKDNSEVVSDYEGRAREFWENTDCKYPPAKPGALVVSRSKRHDVTATRSLAPPKGGYSSNRSCSSRRSSRSCCWTYSRTTRSSCPTVET